MMCDRFQEQNIIISVNCDILHECFIAPSYENYLVFS